MEIKEIELKTKKSVQNGGLTVVQEVQEVAMPNQAAMLHLIVQNNVRMVHNNC